MCDPKNILLVGMPQEQLSLMEELLVAPEYRVTGSDNLMQAMDLLPPIHNGLVIVHAHLSGMGCDAFVRQIHAVRPGLAVLVMAPDSCMEHAMLMMAAGVSDYLVYPVEPELLKTKLNQLLIVSENRGLIANAPKTRQAVQLAQRVAGTSATILITGESGSGKEVFARYVHRCSDRANAPFVAVNCAAIPETMLESILFGHEKGAFTGATTRSPGKFEQANGGTLFLDEVAEMPLEQQAKLLRVLQEKEVERLGGTSPVAVDVRVISATNRHLEDRVRSGHFREDLFYRLNVFPIHLEPLRHRREDIIPLARRLIEKLSKNSGQPPVSISPQAERILKQYDWPGNIRELENVIQRACVLKRGWVILPEDLMLPEVVMEQGALMTDNITDDITGKAHVSNTGNQFQPTQFPGAARKQREWQHLIEVLQRNQGQRNRTAEELGMTTRMLRYKLAQLREAGIDVDSLIHPVAAAIAC